MFQERFPIFERDMILKADMLTCLKEYPKNMFELQYAEYSNGIITGTKVDIVGNNLVIRPGIIKWKNKLLLMEEEKIVPYEATGIQTYLKVRFLEEENTTDFTVYKSEIVLEEEGIAEVDELELCRFLLKTGAKLRQDYQNLEDFTTLHNTINIVHSSYAGYELPTLSPIITQYFGREMLKLPLENPFDISFSMLCMQCKPVERNVIESYIVRRLNVREESFGNENRLGHSMRFTNDQLHKYMVRILEDVLLGRNGGRLRDGVGRRMIVE